tara:strand:+ start:319 stop:582 length:264 start_codon:yes stop_codon:yes gene_type:complete
MQERKSKIFHIKREVCIEQCITQHFKVEALNATMAVNLVYDDHVEAYHDKIWFNETTDVGVPVITSEEEMNGPGFLMIEEDDLNGNA